MTMTFRVYGIPVPQGSMRGFVHRGKVGKPRAILTTDNAKVLPWRQDVAIQAVVAGVPRVLGPVRLGVRFSMPHPVSRPKRHFAPDVRPDLDKLLRAIMDALTGIAWRDDAQVCDIHAAKVYDTFVGADISVSALGVDP